MVVKWKRWKMNNAGKDKRKIAVTNSTKNSISSTIEVRGRGSEAGV